MLNTIFSLLLFTADFEAGYVPNWSSMIYKTPKEYSYNCTRHTGFISGRFKAEIKGFYFSEGVTTFASPVKHGCTAMPFRAVFDTELGYTYRTITLKYAHNCGHTIVTNSKGIYESAKLTDVAYDKFSVCISFKNR